MSFLKRAVAAVATLRADIAKHVTYYENGKRRIENNELVDMFVAMANRRAELMADGTDESLEIAASVESGMEQIATLITRGPGSEWYAFESKVLKNAEKNATAKRRQD